MNLTELKLMLGIPQNDTSKDAYYELMLESGLLAAQEYCDKVDFLSFVDTETGLLVLPAPIRLGILEWVRATERDAKRGSVVHESIGGLTQTYAEYGNIYSTAHAHWMPYHSMVKFYPMGRRR
ncbi:hypothetical protein EauM23_00020 [Exiguobacterium phage vB_EauM-23]|nr:hypothetical protein EauM23_00020 [Exiguobacterium phage vB_EauM-23]